MSRIEILLETDLRNEMRFAREVSDRVCFFDKGRICEQGKPDEIFGAPRQERTREFLASVLG